MHRILYYVIVLVGLVAATPLQVEAACLRLEAACLLSETAPLRPTATSPEGEASVSPVVGEGSSSQSAEGLDSSAKGSVSASPSDTVTTGGPQASPSGEVAAGQRGAVSGQRGAMTTQWPRLEASLLTCSPGTEAYEVYGHTALRLKSVEDPERDFVFNYGVFSFDEDWFLMRWLLGKTDYSVEIVRYNVFSEYYARQGRTIAEQHLNLRPNEVERLAMLLTVDVQAAAREGWTYRYNFFYDNCTTRALDAVAAALDDDAHIEWPAAERQTLRKMLHQFTDVRAPWLGEGQDFLIGTEVDSVASLRQQLFSPIWASYYAGLAEIVRADGSREPLVAGPEVTMPEKDVKNPLELPFAIVGLALLAAIIFQRFKGGWWWANAAIHMLQGVVGVLVAFLFLFSTHPAVDSNWLIVMFNPLWLVAAWYVWRYRGVVKDRAGWYYIGSIALLLILMLVGKACGQNYPLTVILLNSYFLLCLPNNEKIK